MIQQPMAPPQPKNSQFKVLAIVLLAVGHFLALVAALTTVFGIGLCLVPFALMAEIAGFVFLCLV